jgi:hypothetical protein
MFWLGKFAASSQRLGCRGCCSPRPEGGRAEAISLGGISESMFTGLDAPGKIWDDPHPLDLGCFSGAAEFWGIQLGLNGVLKFTISKSA